MGVDGLLHEGVAARGVAGQGRGVRADDARTPFRDTGSSTPTSPWGRHSCLPHGLVGLEFWPGCPLVPVASPGYAPALGHADVHGLLVLVQAFGESPFDSPRRAPVEQAPGQDGGARGTGEPGQPHAGRGRQPACCLQCRWLSLGVSAVLDGRVLRADPGTGSGNAGPESEPDLLACSLGRSFPVPGFRPDTTEDFRS